MRKIGLILAFCLGLAFESPALAFESASSDAEALQALFAQGRDAPALRRTGRTIVAFAIEDQAVVLTAYGRRARARAMGNAEDIWRARAMGKVFDGAPQPALLTVELSLRF